MSKKKLGLFHYSLKALLILIFYLLSITFLNSHYSFQAHVNKYVSPNKNKIRDMCQKFITSIMLNVPSTWANKHETKHPET